MQNIEINTTQNVSITYEVANLGDRVFAFLIDLAIIGGGFLVSMIFSAIFMGESTSWVFYMLSVPFAVFYTLASEILMKGQTLGKKALRTQVVKLNGTDAKSSDYFLRWVFRLIDIYSSVGMLAVTFIVTSKKGQRLGDIVSETSIIRIKPSSEMSLWELMGKYKNEGYEVAYPQVSKLSEKDLLLVQTVLLRYKKYQNKAHRDVLFELVSKIKTKLDLDERQINQDGTQFLSQLIKDYIFLTR